MGLASARALAEAGACVVTAGRNAERGRRAADQIEATGGSVRFVQTDVRDDAAVATLARRAVEEFGSLDIWLNNAGTEGPPGPPLGFEDEAVRALLETNLKGVYSGIRHAAATMGEDGGVIVNTASFIGTRVNPPPAIVYGATKAGVVAMTASAAPLLAGANIDLYAICPCIVDTPMVDRLTGGAGEEARGEFAGAFAPSGRLTPPEDVARFIVDLCAGTTDFKSGDAILVDAGPTVEPL
jgi:NAD(P)-dependent dehydrogenase (short-subunit alcohol dehydrogenase family)